MKARKSAKIVSNVLLRDGGDVSVVLLAQDTKIRLDSKTIKRDEIFLSICFTCGKEWANVPNHTPRRFKF
jgi:hypothetical protein